MPQAQDLWISGERQLCSAKTFLYCLGVEIERYKRYGRAFAMVLIQPPVADDHPTRLQATQIVSEHALRMVRTCDVVAIFERGAFLVALLPETDADGTQTVFDRFDEQMVQPGLGGTLKFATYPEHATSIEYFLDRFTELFRKSGREPQLSEANGGEWQETAAVSQSWEDITASK